jgi:hypothetical protein
MNDASLLVATILVAVASVLLERLWQHWQRARSARRLRAAERRLAALERGPGVRSVYDREP